MCYGVGFRRADFHAKTGRDHGPYSANRLLALLSAMFTYAAGLGYEGGNPARGVKRFKEQSRDRFLRADEIRAFFAALNAEPDETWQDFFALALLTDHRTEAASHDDASRREPSEGPVANPKAERRGLFTSGFVSTSEGRRIALFFSGRRHAGENLADVLAHRAGDLPAPIQMCDALSRNLPAAFKTLLANCLAHGRRQFVDAAERFPDECRYVLESMGSVYKNDAIARERTLSPEERLAFHQTESGPIMEKLQAWCTRQFAERLVEPNSGLGAAISYLLRHWEKLTLFLREPGAPLDNNIVERALKRAIVHRKNSLFYKTMNGAHVGDIFMSLIYTCQLCGADPFDYLTELQGHAEGLGAGPENWMPWNYRERIEPAPRN